MTIYRYDESANPDGAYLPGVPLRDLTIADLDGLPDVLRRSISACPWYRSVAPDPATTEPEEGQSHG
jgi:hypothetical protein